MVYQGVVETGGTAAGCGSSGWRRPCSGSALTLASFVKVLHAVVPGQAVARSWPQRRRPGSPASPCGCPWSSWPPCASCSASSPTACRCRYLILPAVGGPVDYPGRLVGRPGHRACCWPPSPRVLLIYWPDHAAGRRPGRARPTWAGRTWARPTSPGEPPGRRAARRSDRGATSTDTVEDLPRLRGSVPDWRAARRFDLYDVGATVHVLLRRGRCGRRTPASCPVYLTWFVVGPAGRAVRAAESGELTCREMLIVSARCS